MLLVRVGIVSCAETVNTLPIFIVCLWLVIWVYFAWKIWKEFCCFTFCLYIRQYCGVWGRNWQVQLFILRILKWLHCLSETTPRRTHGCVRSCVASNCISDGLWWHENGNCCERRWIVGPLVRLFVCCTVLDNPPTRSCIDSVCIFCGQAVHTCVCAWSLMSVKWNGFSRIEMRTTWVVFFCFVFICARIATVTFLLDERCHIGFFVSIFVASVVSYCAALLFVLSSSQYWNDAWVWKSNVWAGGWCV